VYDVAVVVDGEAVPRRPQLTVTAAVAAAHATTVQAAALLTAVAGDIFSVSVTPHDHYGNVALPADGHRETAAVEAELMVDGAHSGTLGWLSHAPVNVSISVSGATVFSWQVCD
jgi:hypothetical protein